MPAEPDEPATTPSSSAAAATPATATPSTAAAATAATPATTTSKKKKKKGEKKKRSWLPLESNPTVLSAYARALGAPASTSFEDVCGLDDELLGMVPEPVLALLLLFPITKSYEVKRVEQERELRKKMEEQDKGGSSSSALPYFSRQTIGNACGTVGLIHSFASIRGKVSDDEGGEQKESSQQQQQQQRRRVFEPGSFLERFYEATAAMTPDERAAFLEAADDDDDEEEEEGGGGTQTQKTSTTTGEGEEEDEERKKIRETRAALAASIDAAHAAAAIEGDTRPPGADEAVDLHFVAFVESGGKLWELDGRKVAPVEHGATSGETFLKDAARAIEREFVRSETAEGSLNFNLLALVGGGGGEGGGGHGGEGGGGGGVGE